MTTNDSERLSRAPVDHSSDPNFVAYYEQASLSEETKARFETVCDKVLGLIAREGGRGALSRSRTSAAAQVPRLRCGLSSGTTCMGST